VAGFVETEEQMQLSWDGARRRRSTIEMQGKRS